MNFLGACGPTQTLHAFGNGAAGHHDDLATVFGHERHLAAPFTDGRFVKTAPFVGDQTGADLDHDAPRIAQNSGRKRLAHGVQCIANAEDSGCRIN